VCVDVGVAAGEELESLQVEISNVFAEAESSP
jgi:hypothetical protein